jgi:LPS-assembly protein
MKNKIQVYFLSIVISLFYISPIYSTDQFNFNVTEIEIVDEGNKFIGKKRGKIITDNNIEIGRVI